MSEHANVDALILNLVQTEAIREQADLQEILQKRGIDIPQATLSRRLKKLKIAKVEGIYKVIEFSPLTLPPVLNMQISEFGMIVLQTHPGNANSLAYHIDRKYVSYSPQRQSGILGTIAGDDTVLLIIRNKKELSAIAALLQEEFPYLSSTGV